MTALKPSPKAEENDKKSKSSWGQPEPVEGLALESSWPYQLFYGMDMFCSSSHQPKLILIVKVIDLPLAWPESIF